MKKGKFIVIEGIDGAGGETQSKLLFEYLKKKKVRAQKLHYPDYNSEIGKIINNYLYKKNDFSNDVQVLLHGVDFLKDRGILEEWIERGNIVISDRHFTSTIAYQGVKGFKRQNALLFAKIFQMPKPDLVIYIRIGPETSIKRKTKEKKVLDRNEKDMELLRNAIRQYDKMAKENIFGKWKIVDGEKSIDKVHEEIIKIISK